MAFIASKAKAVESPMANAETVNSSSEGMDYERIWLIGPPGSGKTTQVLTLSGRILYYNFDPAGLKSLRDASGKIPDRITVLRFQPDPSEVDVRARSVLQKGQPTLKDATKFNKGKKLPEPKTYNAFVDDFNARGEAGEFINYDWLVMDSTTTLAWMAMERERYLQNESGRMDERMDYRIAGEMMSGLIYSATSLPCNVLFCGHYRVHEEELTKAIVHRIFVPGGCRDLGPTFFSNLLITGYDTKDGFYLQLRPDRRNLTVRSDLRTVETDDKDRIDATIRDWRHPEKYGLGSYLRAEGLEPRNTKD